MRTRGPLQSTDRPIRSRLVVVSTVCCLVAALAAPGCDWMHRAADESRPDAKPVALIPSAHVPFRDIPIPSGFKMMMDRSSDFVDTKNRFVAHEFVGRADVGAVREFYREQLREPRWKWLVTMTSFGEYYLTFAQVFVDESSGRRVQEWCWLNMSQLKDGRTRLRVVVTPAPVSVDE